MATAATVLVAVPTTVSPMLTSGPKASRGNPSSTPLHTMLCAIANFERLTRHQLVLVIRSRVNIGTRLILNNGPYMREILKKEQFLRTLILDTRLGSVSPCSFVNAAPPLTISNRSLCWGYFFLFFRPRPWVPRGFGSFSTCFFGAFELCEFACCEELELLGCSASTIGVGFGVPIDVYPASRVMKTILKITRSQKLLFQILQ